MNALGIMFIWATMQATLLCAATALIYLMVRRRQPGVGATAALAGLLLSGLLTLGIVSPWPRWSLAPEDPSPAAASVLSAAGPDLQFDGVTSAVAELPSAGTEMEANRPTRVDVEPSISMTLGRLCRDIMGELSGPPPANPGYRWTAWLAWALLVSMAFGIVRLLAGWVGVRNCLKRSRRIEDRSLAEDVATLCSELGYRRMVEIRESDDVACAATVGCRRALILLPTDWRGWTHHQRRAVLAHELAHVAAGDASTWLAAQFGLLLHFYHPLTHWLAQRLRLEQELAADAVAARLIGSAQSYLTTLAELAVRHSERSVPWPVRNFLPTPGTLLRRIEMLRDTDAPMLRSSNIRRGMAIGLVVACAVMVAGLRPMVSQSALAESETKSVEARQMAAMKGRSRENLKMITLAFHNYEALNGHFPPAVLRGPDGKTTYSWRVAILPFLGEEQLYNQYDRSQPWDSERNQQVLKQIPAVLRHPLDAADSTNAGYFVFTGADTATGEAGGQGIAMREFLDGTSNTLLAVEARRDIPWTKPEDLPYAKDQAPPKIGGWFEVGFLAAISDGSVHFLDSQISEQRLREVITRNGGEVVDLSVLAAPTTGTPAPVPTSAPPRELARLDLKKIGLAFHGYHDLFLHFPPPVLYGPDGKTPYSWRVELLPVLKYYVEQQKPNPLNGPITREAYNKLIAECGYDLSQPWDSEANRRVLAQIPDAYLSPLDDPGSINASYFVLAGPGTAVGNTPGTGIALSEFLDGTSNTLLLVEAKADVPWTKPEDIPFGPKLNLTDLKKWDETGFHIAFADGRTAFIAAPPDASSMQILITRDGGEVAIDALKKLGLE